VRYRALVAALRANMKGHERSAGEAVPLPRPDFGKMGARRPHRRRSSESGNPYVQRSIACPRSRLWRRTARGTWSACRTNPVDSFLSSSPTLCRPSTRCRAAKEGVDAREKPAHDEFELFNPPRRLVEGAEKLSPDGPALWRRQRDGWFELIGRRSSARYLTASLPLCEAPARP